MHKITERLREIEERKAALRGEVANPETSTDRLAAIKIEAENLASEERSLRSKQDLSNLLGGTEQQEHRNPDMTTIQKRAKQLAETGTMHLPLFVEERSVLVSSGKLATPTAVATEIGEMPAAVSSIVDDVEAIDATGTGAWDFPYKKSDAVAAGITEGQTIRGTGATFDTVSIGPKDWGVLDEISNKVAKTTPVAYERAVRNSSYTALRVKAKEEIITAVMASTLLEKRTSIPLDKDYLNTVVLGYGDDETVPGGTTLYITKNDLATLGMIQGTGENRHYKISYNPDMNSGTISDGGLTVRFVLTKVAGQLVDGIQLYGKPTTVKMLNWGDYAVTTDDGGDYFKRSMLGIKAEATAGADLTVWHGMQQIKQAAS